VMRRLEAAGCRRFIHTEVARDGMLSGPATDRLSEVLAATSRPVVASGGVASLGDLRALAALEPNGLEGAIVGRALYAGRFTVADALAALTEAGGPGGPAVPVPGARAAQPQPPAAGAPEREGSPDAGGAGGAVHSPPNHPPGGRPA
jgi:tRNA-dihydrouridine synthase